MVPAGIKQLLKKTTDRGLCQMVNFGAASCNYGTPYDTPYDTPHLSICFFNRNVLILCPIWFLSDLTEE